MGGVSVRNMLSIFEPRWVKRVYCIKLDEEESIPDSLKFDWIKERSLNVTFRENFKRRLKARLNR